MPRMFSTGLTREEKRVMGPRRARKSWTPKSADEAKREGNKLYSRLQSSRTMATPTALQVWGTLDDIECGSSGTLKRDATDQTRR